MKKILIPIIAFLTLASCAKEALNDGHPLIGRWQHRKQEVTVYNTETKEIIVETGTATDFTARPSGNFIVLKPTGKGDIISDKAYVNAFDFTYTDNEIRFIMESHQLLYDSSTLPSGEYRIAGDTLYIHRDYATPLDPISGIGKTYEFTSLLLRAD
ncbi:hypothetical protein M8998_04905 [Sphingobacterium sp. lm-10]|uniref:hypothetical protein n=1 Tax=Sphingobacterium sp. lm-10 TaxID=2944904 RepID=UPI00201FF1DA|nr:hypothetical protein [Sphingobacterium sp. lm-10]MCL7987277.1 hypothetical protein [Sphingobacterium sp. lm-10]